MIDTVEIREIVQNLLHSQRLAVLSTQMSGRPYSNLVAFAATENMGIIPSWCLPDTSGAL